MVTFRECLYTLIDKNYILGDTGKILLMAAVMLASAVIAYLLGSLNFAIIISKLFYHDDVRNYGSHNAGTTNMLRTYGKLAAGLTLLGDMLKCAVAIVIGSLLWIDGAYIAGLFCVIGHIFPCYYKFRGGKGVAATAIVVFMTSPVVFLVLAVVFAIIALGTKFISLASIMCALLYPVLQSSWNNVIDEEGSFNVVMAFLLMAIIVITHRENIKRLLDKTEPKISIGKKKKTDNNDQPAESDGLAEEPKKVNLGNVYPNNKKKKKGKNK